MTPRPPAPVPAPVPPPIAATVLAAGLGRRLGNRPKATLEIDGRSILERLTTALRDAGIDDLSLVIGPYAEQLLPLAAACGLRVLAHRLPDSSLIDSQRLALQAHVARHAGADLVLVVADLPLLAATHVAPVLQAWRQRPDGIEAMMPLVGGVRGHPVLLSWQAVSRIVATPDHQGIRDWLGSHPATVQPFPATDPAYIFDVDTPADVDRLRTLVHPAPVVWRSSQSFHSTSWAAT